jgi:hypothetical protein
MSVLWLPLDALIIAYPLMGRLIRKAACPLRYLHDHLFSIHTIISLPSSATPSLLYFQPYDLIGRSFLDVPCKDGIQHWVYVTKAIADHRYTLDKHPDMVKFLLESSTAQYEKVMT